MSILDRFCQFETAYLVHDESFPAILDAWADGVDLFKAINKDLPEGVKLREYGINGASGVALTFETYELFTESLLIEIENVLSRFNDSLTQ